MRNSSKFSSSEAVSSFWIWLRSPYILNTSLSLAFNTFFLRIHPFVWIFWHLSLLCNNSLSLTIWSQFVIFFSFIWVSENFLRSFKGIFYFSFWSLSHLVQSLFRSFWFFGFLFLVWSQQGCLFVYVKFASILLKSHNSWSPISIGSFTSTSYQSHINILALY